MQAIYRVHFLSNAVTLLYLHQSSFSLSRKQDNRAIFTHSTLPNVIQEQTYQRTGSLDIIHDGYHWQASTRANKTNRFRIEGSPLDLIISQSRQTLRYLDNHVIDRSLVKRPNLLRHSLSNKQPFNEALLSSAFANAAFRSFTIIRLNQLLIASPIDYGHWSRTLDGPFLSITRIDFHS